MNLSRKFSTLIIVLYLVLTFTGCENAEITFHNQDDLKGIILSEYGGKNNFNTKITDIKEIKNIFNDIKSNSKKTNKESVGEIPINIENYIELEILYSTDKGKLQEFNYIYKIKGNYYIERPYDGIWKIEEESYDNIYELLYNSYFVE